MKKTKFLGSIYLGGLHIFVMLVFLLACTNPKIIDDPIPEPKPEPIVSTGGYYPCKNGKAGDYPCDGYDLQSLVSITEMKAKSANDIWGWTDPVSKKEYAIIGLDNGTAFVDISNPRKPVYLGKLPTATTNSKWRDVKVHKNHAFIVSEAAHHGLQIFDLTRLRNVTQPPETFTVDTHYTKDFGDWKSDGGRLGNGDAHNIFINEESNTAYILGTSGFGKMRGGSYFLDVSNPKTPIFSGGKDLLYSHDAQVVNYKGPDTKYKGKEIFIGSNKNYIVIYDVTDKAIEIRRPVSEIKYEQLGYVHQGWLSEDHRYFFVGDEFDEQRHGIKTRTLVFDVSDLENPKLHHTYFGKGYAVDHNGYIKKDTFYLANYTMGVRMIDIKNIDSKQMEEVAYFDTYPLNDGTQFAGAWSVYPYFSSGNIIVSNIDSGLFIIKKTP